MRSGLLKKLTFPDPLTNQLVANLSDAINTLSGDDDVFTAPSTVLTGTGKIPAGAATIFYRGAPGAQLTLPPAQSQAVQGNARAALVVLGNEASGAVTLMASGSDTINGAKSLSVGAGALQMVVSDGFNQWLVLAPATILGWITSLTGDVVATGPGAAAATIQANVVTNAKAAQMAANTIKGNNTAGTANAADLTATQATAMLNTFTSALKGLAPASGGGTANFLRADGTWAPIPGKTLIRLTFLTGTSLAAAAGTTLARVYIKAGGGGGGGASGSVAAASGGAEGGEAEFQTSTIPATWNFVLGAAGTAGSSAGGNGGAGGNSTFSDGTTTVTANGGPGGTGSTSASGPNTIVGASAPAVSTNGSYNGSGEPGGAGLELNNAGSAAISGSGGGKGGGAGRTSAGAGAAAVGPGAGGGGAVSVGVGAAGGAGKAGWGVLEEWG